MPEISLPLTSLAALINGLLLALLTFNVVRIRRRDRVVLGDNGDRVLLKAIRGQANAAEQIPLALILSGLLELQGGGGAALLLALIVFTLGRLSHGAYFALHGTHWRFRFWGMTATLIGQVALLLLLLGTLLQ